MNNMPPFQITPRILFLSQEISKHLGILQGAKLYPLSIHLRKNNKIKTIQSSLAIEGNTLTTKQITAISEGKRILGKAEDILEVKNAMKVYGRLTQWDPLSITNLIDAHKLLMQNLITENGQWRKGGVGIFKGKKVKHIAPPAKRVPILIENLFNFINFNNDTPWLLKACIFHYEFVFIHPFIDGNGRMGRLWQQLLLMKEDPIFEFFAVESLIKENQQLYYDVLEYCDKTGNSTEFIVFSLEQILATLKQNLNTRTQAVLPMQRLLYAKDLIRKTWFNRKGYMNLHRDISTATASRDLLFGVQERLLQKQNTNNKTTYFFI